MILALVAAFLIVAAIDIYRQSRKSGMSVEVKGLADAVRKAKAGMAAASTKTAKLEATANALNANLDQIDSITQQLDSANAELQATIGQISNGGPELEPSQNKSTF